MRTKDGAIRENPVRTDGYQMLANAIILQAVQDYRKATGVECLTGYLFLLGDEERICELIRIGILAVDSSKQ